ncbi:MAG: hypothetical protein ACUVWS_18205 [Roseiflexus sp.]
MNRAIWMAAVAVAILGVFFVASTVVSSAMLQIGSTHSTPTLTPIRNSIAPSLPALMSKATEVIEQRERHFDNQRATPQIMRIPSTPDPNLHGTTVPPDYRPDWINDVEPVTKADLGGVSFLRNATSIWRNGGLPNIQGTEWFPLFHYAVPGTNDHPIISSFIPNAPPDLQQKLTQSWECPRAIGTLTITMITGGSNGTIEFVSSTGVTGSLNMATGEWIFNQ